VYSKTFHYVIFALATVADPGKNREHHVGRNSEEVRFQYFAVAWYCEFLLRRKVESDSPAVDTFRHYHSGCSLLANYGHFFWGGRISDNFYLRVPDAGAHPPKKDRQIH
jgi:hypothetical protein